MKKRGGGRISRRLGVWGYVLTLTMMATQVIFAQDRGQGRSMVISRGGMVAAESPLAAQAGVRMLERGGNAVDAAIATNAMMGVVEPMMNGIGGDLFAIVYDAKANKLYGLNASGWAPKGLTIEYLQKQGIRSMPQQGVNAITVPGAVDGWQKPADKFGRKKLAEDLAAAIRTAQDGFPVPEWTAAYCAAEVNYLRTDETAEEMRAGSDTTYLSVVDRDGNMVSPIQSNYQAFGSGIVAAGTGFALHDRGGLFSIDATSPNALAGRKRPLHTIIPAFAQKGDVRVAFGIMGGWNQSQAHAQFVANLVDFKMNIQAALEAPRFSKHTFGGCDVMMENRLAQNVRNELTGKGHKVDAKGAFSSGMGGGQAGMRDFSAGVNYGASDPRKDGQAVAELPFE